MSRRSLRISLFLVGLGAGNRDMNLNISVSSHMAGRVQTYPVPPLSFYGCVYLVGLCSDLGLQVPDQLRCGFTGEVFKAGNLKAGKQLADVSLLVLCSFGQRK
jgi:hypothetical protein